MRAPASVPQAPNPSVRRCLCPGDPWGPSPGHPPPPPGKRPPGKPRLLTTISFLPTLYPHPGPRRAISTTLRARGCPSHATQASGAIPQNSFGCDDSRDPDYPARGLPCSRSPPPSSPTPRPDTQTPRHADRTDKTDADAAVPQSWLPYIPSTTDA